MLAAMPLAAGAAESVAPRVQRFSLWLAVAVGLALRLANAATAVVHGDERHYVTDAYWTVAPLRLDDAVRFLRDHVGTDHLQLDPSTGMLDRWPQSGPARITAHPCLYQYVTGLVFLAVKPASTESAVMIGRVVSALADTATIVLLPALATALGATRSVGLVAAGLYAVFPPAAVYGSIANLDPLLAPLLVLLLLAVLHPGPGAAVWVRAGVVTGLLASVKQTGLVALLLVPMASALRPGPRLRGLALWAATAAVVIAVFTNPIAYLDGVRAVSGRHLRAEGGPLTNLAGNLRFLAQIDAYYWLGFSTHGQPLAPLLARVHRVLTPAYLMVYLAGLAIAGGAGQVRRLVALYLPAVLVLAFVPPSNGMWRLHILWPLVCCAAAVQTAFLARPARTAVVVLGVVSGLLALLPQRPGVAGTVDLDDLIFMNPQARQPIGFYGPRNPEALAVKLRPGMTITRRLWFAPGAYQVGMTAAGVPRLSLDGREVLAGGATRASVELSGFVHTLAIDFPAGGWIRVLSIQRHVP